MGETMIAEHFDAVTVLFCDIVGFTQLAAGISPEALVDKLNKIFSEFDYIADRHALEKIKMIGDARSGLFMMDRELGQRTYTATAVEESE